MVPVATVASVATVATVASVAAVATVASVATVATGATVATVATYLDLEVNAAACIACGAVAERCLGAPQSGARHFAWCAFQQIICDDLLLGSYGGIVEDLACGGLQRVASGSTWCTRCVSASPCNTIC